MKPICFCISMLLSMFLALNGCLKMGPDFRRPETGIRTPESFQHATTGSERLLADDQWWRVFNQPELDLLVEEVLKNNPDIKGATARILEMQSQFIRARADRLPALNLQGQVQRQRQTINAPVVTPMGIIQQERRKTTDSHGLSLPASFELDLWGRVARAEEAARADLLQAEENRRTVAQTMVAETINLYLKIESFERRIRITKESIKNYGKSLALVTSRYRRGLAGILDLRQARRTLAWAEASLPVLRQELGIAQQGLAVLVGRYPEARPARTQPEDYFKRLSPVPSGLPSEVLLRRPDIRAAEAGLKALNARLGVAMASRFPGITLTGGFGYSSEELNRLFKPQSELWNLALGIVQPIFDGGRLKAGQRAAEARYEQGVAEYAKTVLNAFYEVESALLTRREQLERRDRVLNFLTEARATQRIAESRYGRGLVDYITVLDAQQTRFQAEENLVLVDLAILGNRVTLHRALGGGWAEPGPVKEKY